MKNMKLFNSLLGVLVIVLFITPSILSAGGTEIQSNYIKVNNKKFRRGGAESASLGAIGVRNKPVIKVSTFTRDSVWKAGKVGIEVGIPVSISSSQLTQMEGNAAVNLDATGTVRASAGMSSQSEHYGKFSIVKMMFTDHGEVIKALNGLSKSERKRIKKLGRKRRIITSVWVLLYGTENSINSISGTASVEDAAGNSADMHITTTKGTDVTFGPGSIVAYEYHKIKFGKKKRIKKLKKDGVWF